MNIPISIKQTNPSSPLQPEETPNFLPLYLTYLRVNHKGNNKPEYVQYISNLNDDIQISEIEWLSEENSLVYFGRIELIFKPKSKITQSRLYIATDENIWHSYLAVHKGLGVTIIKENDIPRDLDKELSPMENEIHEN